MSEESVFACAMSKATPAERAAYLDSACGADTNLRRRVEELLRAHDAAGGFLQQPAVGAHGTAEYEPDGDGLLREGPGTVIGPYKLLQLIGEGGMGVVYMAEQEQPVRRRVALKVIKPGMDSKQVIARFEAERQALAMMDHLHIAKVLDAGTTAEGRPYFVMELVRGVPITKFCDQEHLTPRERLELFVPVCQAIQHAHQKGVIHRDLKPSNILVTLYDGKPVPKVIDFGVAKALHTKLTERTMFTEFGAVVGTLEYMSPEQAEMSGLDVDTRSDVYALGVLLYELLTGTTPFEKKRLRAAALAEVMRIIHDEEPPTPSTRLSQSGESLAGIAAARKTEPAKLTKLMRGELDWIVMRALEKDRARRYETANAFARDVQRYLADEPVEACPPSATYRLRKFARKHTKALATAAAFVTLLFVGLVGATVLAVWATSAEREADRQRITSDEAKQDAVKARAEAERQRDAARLTAYATGVGLAMHAWDENNVVRARELLAEIPTEAAGRDLRGFEWYYLSRLCHFEPRTLKGHASGVTSVAFSPDGQRLASGSYDHTVKIWSTATGLDLGPLKSHAGVVTSVAFSPDGRRLASGSDDQTVKIWDSATGQALLTLEGHTKPVRNVAFSPDGRRLASGSDDQTVRIWDSATGQQLHTLKGHAGIVTSVAFSPDGRRLASGSVDNAAKIWDSTTGQELLTLKGHTKPVKSVTFSPDGRRLASGSDDQTVKIWDSATGQALLTLMGHAGLVTSVAFSPDGRRLASGGHDNAVKIWDGATGQPLVSLREHPVGVTSVAFGPDGQRLASGSFDSTVKIWSSATGQEVVSLKGHADMVTSVAFSPDGRRLASGSRDNTVKIWDSTTCQELVCLRGHAKPVQSVAFSPDGRRLASGSVDNAAKIWDSATGHELLTLKGHTEPVNSVTFSPDGQHLASGSVDQTVKIWDSATGQEVLSLPGHTRYVTSVCFSPDGQRLASGSGDNTVKIWDSATGKELHTLTGHTIGGVRSVAFSPDGQRLASGGADHTVKIWDSATGHELLSLKGHAVAVTKVVFSPDGQRLASGSVDQTVKIWDSVTSKELVSLKSRAGPVRAVAFNADGQRLASGNEDGSIKLWERSVSPEVQERRAAHAAALPAKPPTPEGK
jgi:WD40 repeat protein/serine/threonine protein kinase